MRAYIVWTNVLAADDEAAAREQAGAFTDPRVICFYDPDWRSGTPFAIHVSDGVSAKAWDVYMFFAPGARWEDSPPRPVEWAHQLGASTGKGAEEMHFHTGELLVQELKRAMACLTPKR